MGKSYCARHDRAYEDACDYCEPAVAKSQAASAPTCTMMTPDKGAQCGALAVWAWTPVTPESVRSLAAIGNVPQRYCDRCHQACAKYYPGWKKEPIVAPGQPSSQNVFASPRPATGYVQFIPCACGQCVCAPGVVLQAAGSADLHSPSGCRISGMLVGPRLSPLSPPPPNPFVSFP